MPSHRNRAICLNHPDREADPVSEQDGPPLCAQCAAEAGLPELLEYRPRVVMLCGSMRFCAEIERAAKEEITAGKFVLWPDPRYSMPDPAWPGDAIEQIKARLAQLHRAKIQLADEVLVVAPGGYIGAATQTDIDYAQRLGRPVRYWRGGS